MESRKRFIFSDSKSSKGFKVRGYENIGAACSQLRTYSDCVLANSQTRLQNKIVSAFGTSPELKIWAKAKNNTSVYESLIFELGHFVPRVSAIFGFFHDPYLVVRYLQMLRLCFSTFLVSQCCFRFKN